MSRASLVYEFWSFMRIRKKWWLLPIIVVMLAAPDEAADKIGAGIGNPDGQHRQEKPPAAVIEAAEKDEAAR